MAWSYKLSNGIIRQFDNGWFVSVTISSDVTFEEKVIVALVDDPRDEKRIEEITNLLCSGLYDEDMGEEMKQEIKSVQYGQTYYYDFTLEKVGSVVKDIDKNSSLVSVVMANSKTREKKTVVMLAPDSKDVAAITTAAQKAFPSSDQIKPGAKG